MNTQTESVIKEKDRKAPPPRRERLLKDRKAPPPRRERLLNDRKERLLSDLELARLEGSLSQHEKEQPSSSEAVNAIRFLLYTGCRISELLNLRWADVHLEEGYLDLKDARTGTKIIPLMDRAKRIMTPLQQQEGASYVFFGNLRGNPLTNIKRTWHEVCALAGIGDARLYDLRYSFASFASKKGD
jgi:integrase